MSNLKFNFTVREAAEASGLSVSYLYKRSAARQLPLLKVGNRVLIPVADFEAWLDLHRVDREGKGK